MVVVYDQYGQIVGGKDGEDLNAESVIFANVPDEGNIPDVYKGTWIYYIDPKFVSSDFMKRNIRAELYRVDNAQTNEGQRLVSDTKPVEFDRSSLTEIELSSSYGN